MRVYPIMLPLAGKSAVVVGAGEVGLRRAQSLARAGAAVTLVTNRAPGGAAPEGVRVVRENYRPEHLSGAMLVLACSDDCELNARIARDARRLGALVNVADRPEHCDFYVPATVADGDVVAAVSTGGAAPALARRLEDLIGAALPPRIGAFASLLGELRDHLKAAGCDPPKRRRIMKKLASDETYEAFISAGPQAVRQRLQELKELT